MLSWQMELSPGLQGFQYDLYQYDDFDEKTGLFES